MRKSILGLLLLCLACETPFDAKIDKDSKVVVNAFFRPEAPFSVNLTTSNFILDEETVNPLDGAKVTVSNSTGVFEELIYSDNGNYVGTRIVEDDRNFSLNVQANGFPDLTATDLIPKEILASKFEVDRNLKGVNLDDFGYPSKITFNDPLGEPNYYALEIIVLDVTNANNNENFLDGEVAELFFEDTDVNIIQNVDINVSDDNAEAFESITTFPTLYFDDLGFSQEANEIQFFISPLNLRPSEFDHHEIYVVLKSISRAYYDYLKTVDFQREVIDLGVPADPVLIKSNIKNGLGVFGGYNYSILRGTIVE